MPTKIRYFKWIFAPGFSSAGFPHFSYAFLFKPDGESRWYRFNGNNYSDLMTQEDLEKIISPDLCKQGKWVEIEEAEFALLL